MSDSTREFAMYLATLALGVLSGVGLMVIASNNWEQAAYRAGIDKGRAECDARLVELGSAK